MLALTESHATMVGGGGDRWDGGARRAIDAAERLDQKVGIVDGALTYADLSVDPTCEGPSLEGRPPGRQSSVTNSSITALSWSQSSWERITYFC